MNVPQAWQALGFPPVDLASRYNVAIALLDSGVKLDHPDLALRISPKYQFNPVKDFPPGVNDDFGHGTQMAGIIAALGRNDQGIDGMMWGTTIMPCKVAESGDARPEALVDCLSWLARKIDVDTLDVASVNYSFAAFCSVKADIDAAEEGIRYLRAKGVLFVASAGNGAGDNDKLPRYPASIPLSNIIAVTTADRDGTFVPNASGKRTVHVAAPGSDIIPIPVLNRDPLCVNILAGTSVAAAEVTGLIALLRAQDQLRKLSDPSYQERSWQQIRNLVLAGGIQSVSLREVTITGRMVRAWDDCPDDATKCTGSMTCRNQIVRRRLLPVRDPTPRQPGAKLLLRYLSINCETPIQVPVELVDVTDGTDAAPGPGVVIPSLNDSHVPPDEVADDGEYTGEWVVPNTPGRTYRIRFWSDDQEDLTVTVAQ
ncbi:MAG: S8 family serine peptidase [Deltaproteobacteria bacterium]|nr:S8 family serine peptidase [Deltaproteobacteria bacterium]MBI3390934.1 S8 family serine peptidase [Deltaproteobacteria bacterium]